MIYNTQNIVSINHIKRRFLGTWRSPYVRAFTPSYSVMSPSQPLKKHVSGEKKVLFLLSWDYTMGSPINERKTNSCNYYNIDEIYDNYKIITVEIPNEFGGDEPVFEAYLASRLIINTVDGKCNEYYFKDESKLNDTIIKLTSPTKWVSID